MKPKTVVVIAGLPTTGKTSLGLALAERLGIHFVDIDAVPAWCAPPQEANPYRSDEARARERARMTVAYTTMHGAVEANITQGFSVIVSATYSRYSNQDFFMAAVERAGGARVKVLWCQYHDTEEEVARRIDDRLAKSAAGGCRTVAHYFDDKGRYAGIKLPHLVVMMEGGDEGAARAIKQALAYINAD